MSREAEHLPYERRELIHNRYGPYRNMSLNDYIRYLVYEKDLD